MNKWVLRCTLFPLVVKKVYDVTLIQSLL